MSDLRQRPDRAVGPASEKALTLKKSGTTASDTIQRDASGIRCSPSGTRSRVAVLTRPVRDTAAA